MKRTVTFIIFMLLTTTMFGGERHYIHKSVGTTFNSEGFSIYLDKRSYRQGNYGAMLGFFDNRKYNHPEWSEKNVGFNASMYLLMPEFYGFSIPIGLGAKSEYLYYDEEEDGVYYKDDRAVTGFIHTGLIKQFEITNHFGVEVRADFFINTKYFTPNIGIGLKFY